MKRPCMAWPVLSVLIAGVSLSARAQTPPAEPTPSLGEAADLVFYGDTRGGVLQTFLNHRHRPAEIHRAVAERIGSLEGLGAQRAIVFLGDAVSHGGCSKYWDEDFFPALRKLTGFQRDQDYLFYPVIGDHETFLIPESFEESGKVPIQCALFQYLYRAPSESGKRPDRVTRGIHRELTGERGVPAQISCPAEPEEFCSNPSIARNDVLRAHCAACSYQRDRCHGNCVTHTFIHSYSRDNGFGPFQDAWGDSPEGATWYRADFTVSNGAGQSRNLRVLLLDTQAAGDLKARDEMTQAEWLVDRVAELDPTAFVVVAGHLPPPLRPDLYESVLRTAFRRGVRVLAVIAAHYHGFGSGAYLVRSDDVSAAGPQEVYFALSGDGGGRDFDEKEKPSEKRMVGVRIGDHIRVAGKPGAPWSVDQVRDASSFVRMRVLYGGPEITEYRVPLKSVVRANREGGTSRYVEAKEAMPLRSMTLPPEASR